MKLYCNNKLAINISHNPIKHDRTKHIGVDRYFNKEKLEEEVVCVSTMIFKIHGPRACLTYVMKLPDFTHLTKTRRIFPRQESLKRLLGKVRSNFSKACLRQSVWDSKSPK